MKIHGHLIRLALVTACCAALPARAGDLGPTFDFNVHGGVTAGNLRTVQVENQAMGFDLTGRFPMGATGAFTVALGFDYYPGRDHDAMPNSGPVYYNYQTPVTTYQGQPLWLNPANSIDWRKNYAQGFSLKVGYTDKFQGQTGWYWFAGGSLDVLKTTGQFSGTLIPSYGAAPGTLVPGYEPVDPSNPGGPVKDYYEGWAFVTDKTRMNLGAYGGVGVPLTADINFELRVRNIGFTNLDYRPFTYTGTTAVVQESTKRGWVFELGLSLNL